MIILHVIFWSIVFLTFWTYAGYYLFLRLVSRLITCEVIQSDNEPLVTLIITCYNEERRIRQKLENSMALDYPSDLLEVIVVSDGSTDKTEQIVREYTDRGVQLLRINERHGKHFGQGQGIRVAANELIVLSDATTFLETDAVRKIIRNFADPSVGCVSGWDRVASEEDKSQGEGFYVSMEMKLRQMESKVGSLIGVSGCFFAVRKSLCSRWYDNLSSDFYLPILVKEQGYRSIIESQAIGQYRVLHDTQREFTRKVRTVVHGLEVLFKFSQCLNPFKFGLFALQMFSHKLLRWMVPFWMILALPLNLTLLNESFFYSILLAGQIIFYITVTLALLSENLAKKTALKIPLFFASVNLSILVAWYKYLTQVEYVVWDSTKR